MPDTWLAPAKINLFLHINSKRTDGYHNLQTVFQLLDYYDELHFKVCAGGNIRRNSGNEIIPKEQDLIVKSAKLLQQITGTTQGVDIDIVKRIPSGGGLGGGSSNAATTLVALNCLWQTKLTQQQLMDIGLKLGADVPVFIYGQSAWAEGRGEILSPINTQKWYFLVVFINKHMSTQKIFSHKSLTMTPRIGKIADFSELRQAHNDCLKAALVLESEVGKALTWLNTHAGSVDKARMTGTGSCVFMAFANEEDALAAFKKMPNQWSGFVAQAIKNSPMFNWAVAKR